MRPKEGISETYITQFKSKCEKCNHRLDGKCSYSGMQVPDIQFKVDRYFELSVPGPVDIPCPVFAELKLGHDEERRQVPIGLALERARRGVGPRTLTGKKLGEKG